MTLIDLEGKTRYNVRLLLITSALISMCVSQDTTVDKRHRHDAVLDAAFPDSDRSQLVVKAPRPPSSIPPGYGASDLEYTRTLQGGREKRNTLHKKGNLEQMPLQNGKQEDSSGDTYEDLTSSLAADDRLADWMPASLSWQDPVQPFVQERQLFLPGQYPSQSVLSNLLPGSKATVPKIIHQVFLKGEVALEKELLRSDFSHERWPTVKTEWKDSCKKLHPAWEFRIWNASEMENLIVERYPWFLQTYLAYPRDIHRVDAVRPFILDAYGGVYLDLDVECYRSIDNFLQGHELIFQQEDLGLKSLVNSAIAGVPGLHFWKVWQLTLYQRAPQLHLKPGFWPKRDFEVIAVINSTGPWALRASFETFMSNSSLLRKSYVGAWTINNTNVMVYPAGTWFVPCYWSDEACHRAIEVLVHAGEDIPVWLAGHHKNSGSWFKGVGYNRARPLTFHTSPPFVILVIGVTMYLLRRRFLLANRHKVSHHAT